MQKSTPEQSAEMLRYNAWMTLQILEIQQDPWIETQILNQNQCILIHNTIKLSNIDYMDFTLIATVMSRGDTKHHPRDLNQMYCITS